MYFHELQTVTDTVAFHAQRTPDATAVECEGRTVGYRTLHQESDRAARALLAAGLGPGSRVGYLGKESEFYYEILFACAKSATVLVPVNWRLAAGEVDHILRDSRAEVLFVETEFLPAVADRTALPDLRAVVEVEAPGRPDTGYLAWKSAHPHGDLAVTVHPETPLAQLYTSGTTGLPKGVVLAHRSFFRIRDALAAAGLDWIDWRPGDRSLIGIPGFHVGGLWWAVQGFNAGVTNVAMRIFTSHDAVRLLREAGVTTACVVPAMLQMILAEPGTGPEDFRTLRKIVYGGSPISESLLTRGIEVLGCDFAQIYGLTETGNTAVCLPPADHVVGSPRLKAAGRPYPGVVARAVDDDGTPLAPGGIGEILLHTPAAMLEYWGLTEATDRTLVDGWIHTGDAGYLDEDGYVFICDRIKDTVIVAGENVYPAEVENALCTHPAVAEAAVIGIPHDRWGEAVHAFVVLGPGQRATPRELMLSLRGRIADFKIPTTYEFIDRVPRNPSGKILRRTLRDPYWTGRERQVN
ncbi:MAG TPA: long-chain-fatty-acid--CoA ligase [Streptomyces sp.]